MTKCRDGRQPDKDNTKRIMVWEVGHCNKGGHSISVNPKCFPNWDDVLSVVTDILSPSFGDVRKLIDLRTGEPIQSFDRLKNNGRYVATGNEDFKTENCHTFRFQSSTSIPPIKGRNCQSRPAIPNDANSMPKHRKLVIVIMANDSNYQGVSTEVLTEVILNVLGSRRNVAKETDFELTESSQSRLNPICNQRIIQINKSRSEENTGLKNNRYAKKETSVKKMLSNRTETNNNTRAAIKTVKPRPNATSKAKKISDLDSWKITKENKTSAKNTQVEPCAKENTGVNTSETNISQSPTRRRAFSSEDKQTSPDKTTNISKNARQTVPSPAGSRIPLRSSRPRKGSSQNGVKPAVGFDRSRSKRTNVPKPIRKINPIQKELQESNAKQSEELHEVGNIIESIEADLHDAQETDEPEGKPVGSRHKFSADLHDAQETDEPEGEPIGSRHKFSADLHDAQLEGSIVPESISQIPCLTNLIENNDPGLNKKMLSLEHPQAEDYIKLSLGRYQIDSRDYLDRSTEKNLPNKNSGEPSFLQACLESFNSILTLETVNSSIGESTETDSLLTLGIPVNCTEMQSSEEPLQNDIAISISPNEEKEPSHSNIKFSSQLQEMPQKSSLKSVTSKIDGKDGNLRAASSLFKRKSGVGFLIPDITERDLEYRVKNMLAQILGLLRQSKDVVISSTPITRRLLKFIKKILKILNIKPETLDGIEIVELTSEWKKIMHRRCAVLLRYGPCILALLKRFFEASDLGKDKEQQLAALAHQYRRESAEESAANAFVNLVFTVINVTVRGQAPVLDEVDEEYKIRVNAHVLKSWEIKEAMGIFVSQYLDETNSLKYLNIWRYIPRIFHEYIVGEIFSRMEFLKNIVDEIRNEILYCAISREVLGDVFQAIEEQKAKYNEVIEELVKGFLCEMFDDPYVVLNVIQLGKFIEANMYVSIDIQDSYFEELVDIVICGIYKQQQYLVSKASYLADSAVVHIIRLLSSDDLKLGEIRAVMNLNKNCERYFKILLSDFYKELQLEECFFGQILVDFIQEFLDEIKYADGLEESGFLTEVLDDLIAHLDMLIVVKSSQGKRQILNFISQVENAAVKAVISIKGHYMHSRQENPTCDDKKSVELSASTSPADCLSASASPADCNTDAMSEENQVKQQCKMSEDDVITLDVLLENLTSSLFSSERSRFSSHFLPAIETNRLIHFLEEKATGSKANRATETNTPLFDVFTEETQTYQAMGGIDIESYIKKVVHDVLKEYCQQNSTSIDTESRFENSGGEDDSNK